MKFRRDSDEVSCPKAILTGLGAKYLELGGLVCLRTAGHDGECIALACDAAAADGVCYCCRVPVGEAHRDDCYSAKQDPA
jgi:hypothetical protein